MEQYKKIGSLTGILSDHLWIVRLVIIVVGIKYNNMNVRKYPISKFDV